MKRLVLLGFIILFMACPSAPKNSAKIYIDRRDYDNAREQIMIALKEDPNDYELYCLLGKIEIGLTKWSAASDAFQKAVGIDSVMAINWLIGDKDNVSVYYQAFYNAAVQLMQEKKYKESLHNLAFCRIIDPKNVNIYVLEGRIYSELGEEDKASKAYEEALSRDPENPEAYFSIGEVFYKQKKYDAAVEKFNDAIKYFEMKYKNSSKILFQNLPEVDKSIVQEIVKLYNDKKHDELDELVKVKLGYDTPKAQKRNIEQLNKIVYGLSRSHYMVGMSYSMLDKDDLAIEHLNEMLQFYPNDPDALYYSGEIMMVKLHKFEDAISYFERVTQIKEDDTNAWYYMGACYYHLKEYNKCIEVLEEKVLTLDPKFIDAMTYLASAYKEIGNSKKSYEYLMKADKLQKEK